MVSRNGALEEGNGKAEERSRRRAQPKLTRESDDASLARIHVEGEHIIRQGFVPALSETEGKGRLAGVRVAAQSDRATLGKHGARMQYFHIQRVENQGQGATMIDITQEFDRNGPVRNGPDAISYRIEVKTGQIGNVDPVLPLVPAATG